MECSLADSSIPLYLQTKELVLAIATTWREGCLCRTRWNSENQIGFVVEHKICAQPRSGKVKDGVLQEDGAADEVASKYRKCSEHSPPSVIAT